MAISEARSARNGKVKTKPTKNVKRLPKNGTKKSKKKIVAKVDSGKIEKPLKKQKLEKKPTEISSKKKQLIKDILVQAQKDKVTSPSKGVVNMKKKKKKALALNQAEWTVRTEPKNKIEDVKSLSKEEKLERRKLPPLDPNISKSDMKMRQLNQVLANTERSIEEKRMKRELKSKLAATEENNLPDPKSPKKSKKSKENAVKNVELKKRKMLAEATENDSGKFRSSKKLQKIILQAQESKENAAKNRGLKNRKVLEETTGNDIEISKAKKIRDLISRAKTEASTVNNTDIMMKNVQDLLAEKRSKSSKKLKNVIPESKKQEKQKTNTIESKKSKLPVQKRKKDSDNSKLPKKLKVQSPDTVKVVNNEIKSIKSKKRKLSNEEVEIKSESPTEPPLTRKDIAKCVKAVLKLDENNGETKKSLFNSEKPPIFLLVTCIKVPKVPMHQMRMSLPHSMVSPDDDVALFVSDLKKGRRIDYEKTVHHYEDMLQRHGCSQIKAVMPFNQVKTEYNQYEMKRRLLGSYDYFLVDGRISGHMAHVLGKEFREKRKWPTSVHMDKPDLKAEIDGALKKTTLQIHSKGSCSSVQIATCTMSVEKIVDNVMSAARDLCKSYPGGWGNIRSLRIKTPLGVAIPIYVTLKSKNEVKVPALAPKRPKAYRDVEGELTTLKYNVKVTVAPDGTVNVQRTYDDSDESGSEDANVEDEIEKKVKVDEIKKQSVSKNQMKEESEDDEDEDDASEGDESEDNQDEEDSEDDEDEDDSEEDDDDDDD